MQAGDKVFVAAYCRGIGEKPRGIVLHATVIDYANGIYKTPSGVCVCDGGGTTMHASEANAWEWCRQRANDHRREVEECMIECARKAAALVAAKVEAI